MHKEIYVQCPCCKHEFLAVASTPEVDLERQGQLQLEAHPEVFDDCEALSPIEPDDPEGHDDHHSHK